MKIVATNRYVVLTSSLRTCIVQYIRDSPVHSFVSIHFAPLWETVMLPFFYTSTCRQYRCQHKVRCPSRYPGRSMGRWAQDNSIEKRNVHHTGTYNLIGHVLIWELSHYSEVKDNSWWTTIKCSCISNYSQEKLWDEIRIDFVDWPIYTHDKSGFDKKTTEK